MEDRPRRITVPYVQSFKAAQQEDRLVAITAYDFTFTRLFEQAEVDLILVGDSVGSVIQGEENTIPVTLDEMVYHTRCVARATKHALLIADLPFLSYQASEEQAVLSAGRLLKEGRASAVKLEGGVPLSATIKKLTAIDIPVMGHVGLTPQSFHRMGGHKVQGRSRDGLKAGSFERIIEDALAVQEAGAFSVVLEGIPEELAGEITGRLSIPTIGIGAGPFCDGQILVSYDLLGLDPDHAPRFVKRFAEMGMLAVEAVREYRDEVRGGLFPNDEHSFRLSTGSKRKGQTVKQ